MRELLRESASMAESEDLSQKARDEAKSVVKVLGKQVRDRQQRLDSVVSGLTCTSLQLVRACQRVCRSLEEVLHGSGIVERAWLRLALCSFSKNILLNPAKNKANRVDNCNKSLAAVARHMQEVKETAPPFEGGIDSGLTSSMRGRGKGSDDDKVDSDNDDDEDSDNTGEVSYLFGLEPSAATGDRVLEPASFGSEGLWLKCYRQVMGTFQVEVTASSPIARYGITAGLTVPLDSEISCRMMVGSEFGKQLNAICNMLTMDFDRNMTLTTGSDFGSSVFGVTTRGRDTILGKQCWQLSLSFAKAQNGWFDAQGITMIHSYADMGVRERSKLLKPGVCLDRLPLSLYERSFARSYGAVVAGSEIPHVLDHEHADPERHYISLDSAPSYVPEGQVKGEWLSSVTCSVNGADFTPIGFARIANQYDVSCAKGGKVYTQAVVPTYSLYHNFKDHRFYLSFEEDPRPRTLRAHESVQHPRGVLDSQTRSVVDGVNFDFINKMAAGFTFA
jgi:hypothetical protein